SPHDPRCTRGALRGHRVCRVPPRPEEEGRKSACDRGSLLPAGACSLLYGVGIRGGADHCDRKTRNRDGALGQLRDGGRQGDKGEESGEKARGDLPEGTAPLPPPLQASQERCRDREGPGGCRPERGAVRDRYQAEEITQLFLYPQTPC